MLNVVIFEMRAERNSCARNITLDWIGVCLRSAGTISSDIENDAKRSAV